MRLSCKSPVKVTELLSQWITPTGVTHGSRGYRVLSAIYAIRSHRSQPEYFSIQPTPRDRSETLTLPGIFPTGWRFSIDQKRHLSSNVLMLIGFLRMDRRRVNPRPWIIVRRGSFIRGIFAGAAAFVVRTTESIHRIIHRNVNSIDCTDTASYSITRIMRALGILLDATSRQPTNPATHGDNERHW